MKKFVVKTTKEFTYNDKGFVVKEVVTEESYEYDTKDIMLGGSGGTITSSTIKSSDIYTKVTGDKPYTAKFEVPDVTATAKSDTSGITHSINVSGVINNKTITDIVNEVKSVLEKDFKITPNKSLKF